MVNDNCSICLEALIQHGDGEMEPIGAALCGHCFHVDCFWNWEQAKSSQNMRIGRYGAPCPCPVCNAPVQEFIRLYIEGDNSEHDKLKKELKCVKKRLAQERLRHQRTKQQLLEATSSAARLTASERSVSAPRPRQKANTKSRKPSFMQMAACGMNEYDDEINELCDTVRHLLSSGPTSPPRPVSNQAYQQESIQISAPPRPTSQSQSSRKNTRRLLSSGSLDVSNQGNALSCRTRSATPRPDPPLAGTTASSRTTRTTNNRTSTAADEDVISLSSLLWFPEYESPSCRPPQQETLEAAEARLSSRLSRLASSGSLDPPSLRA